MKTIKIIDLLNMMANGQIPDNIKYQGYYWEWTGDDYETIKDGGEKFLLTVEKHNLKFLNEEVEIIQEEKEIEKIDMSNPISVVHCAMKINELIDEVNKLEESK